MRCLQLSQNARGIAAPNPAVGCVIVHGDRIIGEGFTSAYGGPHAEVNAISSVARKSLLLESTLYVSLEPCSHHGKTPPCADLIIAHKIPEVIIGMKDPNPKVSGRGIEKLKAAGCRVTWPVLEDACRFRLRRFNVFHKQKRPYIILKWAESKDGYIAPDSGYEYKREPYWISGPRSRQLVHKWRSEEQAILVGSGTVLADDPQLTTRDWHGPSPVRIVLDKKGELHTDSRIFDNSAPTLVYSSKKEPADLKERVEWIKTNFGGNFLKKLCADLHQRKILSLIVEGGAQTFSSLITAGLWDEARVFRGPDALGSGLEAPIITGESKHDLILGNDQLKIYYSDPQPLV